MVKRKKSKKKVRKSSKKKPAAPKITPMPTAGRKVTDFESELDRQLAGESPEAPKRGRGRPRKEAPEPEPELDLAIVTPIVKMPFDLWALKNDLDKLKLDDKEARLIAEPLKQLLDYYLPKIPTIAYAWISLSVMSYTVLKSRLELVQKIKKESFSVGPIAVGKGDTSSRPGNGSPPAASVKTKSQKTTQGIQVDQIKTKRIE